MTGPIAKLASRRNQTGCAAGDHFRGAKAAHRSVMTVARPPSRPGMISGSTASLISSDAQLAMGTGHDIAAA